MGSGSVGGALGEALARIALDGGWGASEIDEAIKQLEAPAFHSAPTSPSPPPNTAPPHTRTFDYSSV